MGAEQLAIYSAEANQRGIDSISSFMDQLRMRNVMQRFISSGAATSPARFAQFVNANHLSPSEANMLLGIVDNAKMAFTAPAQQMPYASSPSGIFDRRDGSVVHAAPEKFKPVDYFRVNKDGSVISRKAMSEGEASIMERSGFERGSYRAKGVGAGGAGGEPNVIKTWITPEGKLFHAPNNVMPPQGSKPYSEAGELEKRLLTAQEINSIRDSRRSIRRELDKIKALPNVDFYKSQKERIPDLEAELKDLNDRENEMYKNGNDMNIGVGAPPPPSAAPAELGGLKASDHNGKIIVNPETGERRKSDGKTWNEVK